MEKQKQPLRKEKQDEQICQQIAFDKQSLKKISQGGSKKKTNQAQQSITNKWKNIHKIRYLLFLLQYKQMLQADIDVQKIVWYSKMSQFVGGSSPYQCGEYHNKKLSKFGSIQGIINYLNDRVFIPKKELAQEFQRIRQITKDFGQFFKKKVQQFYAKKNNKKSIEMMKFQPLVTEIKLRTQQIDKIVYLESENVNKNRKMQISVQDLIIIQRETPFRYSNTTEQKKNIEKIIKFFRLCSQQIKSLNRHQMNRLSRRLNETAINHQENLLFQQFNNDQDNKQQEMKQKFSSYNKPSKLMKKTFWKQSENRKLIIFFNIMKEKYQISDQREKQNLYKKCSQFLNTDKTSSDCKHHFLYFCERYSEEFQNMLNQETKKLQISKQLIGKQKEEYIFYEENPLKCEINIQYEPIKLKKQDKSFVKNIYLQDHKKNQSIVPFKFLLNFRKKSQKQSLQQQKNYQKEENEENIVKQKIKNLFHLKASNQVFTVIKNNVDDEIPSSQSNFIILIKKSNIKLQIENVEKQNEDNEKKQFEMPLQCHQSKQMRQQMRQQELIKFFASEKFLSQTPQSQFNRLLLRTEYEKIKSYLDLSVNLNHLLQKTQIDLTFSNFNDLIIEQKNETPTQKDLKPTNQQSTKRNQLIEAFLSQLKAYLPKIIKIELEAQKIRLRILILLQKFETKQDKSFVQNSIILLKKDVENLIQNLKLALTKKREKPNLQFQDLQYQNDNLYNCDRIPAKKHKKS